jgi:hypothetical protein
MFLGELWFWWGIVPTPENRPLKAEVINTQKSPIFRRFFT